MKKNEKKLEKDAKKKEKDAKFKEKQDKLASNKDNAKPVDLSVQIQLAHILLYVEKKISILER